jgi:hypothetical protein
MRFGTRTGDGPKRLWWFHNTGHSSVGWANAPLAQHPTFALPVALFKPENVGLRFAQRQPTNSPLYAC